ncbi:MAG: sterol desaturase family protein [Bacteroidota bacterium]
MDASIINEILYEASYLSIFLIVFAYFLALYFLLGPLFLSLCKWFESKGWVSKIVDKEVPARQIKYEIRHSLVSIVLFGFSAFPVIYLIRNGTIILLEDTVWNILGGLLILNVWNEIHFFIVHRIMHLPFFLKRVHYVHHRSRVPTVYSVYSFHWLEAALLSTVPLTIAVFLPFSIWALSLYPITSILLNYAGHCNYRFGKGTGKSWTLFGTHHNEHHYKWRQNYGFASDLLDRLLSKFQK